MVPPVCVPAGSVVLLEPGGRDRDADEGSLDRKYSDPTEEGPRSQVTAAPTRLEAPATLVTTIRQSWPITNGEIILDVRSEEALPATVFGAIGEVVTKLEALASSLTRGDGSVEAHEGGEP